MRLASLAGRAVIVAPDQSSAVDVATLSDGRFGPSPAHVYDNWADFAAWSSGTTIDFAEGATFNEADLEAPSPSARQIFAIGLNYRAHADESGHSYPDHPIVFTKFVTSFAGPVTELELPTDTVDWEAELVVVIGTEATRVPAADAWAHVAGITLAQDYSERTLQLSGPAPQFSLAKSHRGFTPQGPWLVTLDEFADPDNLAITCTINGETVQDGRTNDMIFSVPDIIEHLSSIVTLLPGDVILTGTPAGVGAGRTPKWFLKPGDVVTTSLEGVGSLQQTCVKRTEGA